MNFVRAGQKHTHLMSALAYLGAQLKSEQIFIELLRMGKKTPGILQDQRYLRFMRDIRYRFFLHDQIYPYFIEERTYPIGLQRELISLEQSFEYRMFKGSSFGLHISDDLFGTEVDEFNRSRIKDHPLVFLVRHLSEGDIANELINALTDSQDYIRHLAFRLISELSGNLFEKQIASALQDREKSIRIAAMNSAEAIVKKTGQKHILSYIVKRLIDDEPEIREKAWNMLSRCEEEGAPVSIYQTTP